MVMGFVLTRNAVVVFWVLFNFYEMVFVLKPTAKDA
jgi:hypothetical protein